MIHLRQFKNFFIYLLKQILSYVFFLAGGVYLLKVLFRNKKVLVILNYHNFSKYNNYKIKRGNILETDYVNSFEKQIRFLKKHFSFCYPEEFFDGICVNGINILITFDDGYKDNFDYALPILKANNTSAIFFLTTAFIGTDKWIFHDKVRLLIVKGILSLSEGERHLLKINNGQVIDPSFRQYVDTKFTSWNPKRIMMNWQEATSISMNGFGLGSHTQNHVLLPSLNKEQQKAELEVSKQCIELEIKGMCKYLAYPNGAFDNNTLNLMDDNRIEFGFTTIPGANTSVTHKKTLKRIGVNASDTIQLLTVKIFNCLFE
jgi:peptidoglycan/xylan/chitin deacetylase (PgdA/CDA1 family)